MKIFLNILWVVGLLVWSCCFAMGFNYGHGDSLLVSVTFCYIGYYGDRRVLSEQVDKPRIWL